MSDNNNDNKNKNNNKNNNDNNKPKEKTFTQADIDKALTAAMDKYRSVKPWIEYRSGITHLGSFEIDLKIRCGDIQLGQALSEVVTKMINITHADTKDSK